MGPHRELLLLLARDLQLAGQVLGRLAHADVVLHLRQPGMERRVEAAHGDGEHVLDAEGDAALQVAGDDRLRELVDGVHRRAAEAVDHLGAGLLGQAGEQRHAAGHQHPLGVLREGAAQHHVLDRLARQARQPVEQRLEHLRRQVVGAHADQPPALGAHRAADGVDDDC